MFIRKLRKRHHDCVIHTFGCFANPLPTLVHPEYIFSVDRVGALEGRFIEWLKEGDVICIKRLASDHIKIQEALHSVLVLLHVTECKESEHDLNILHLLEERVVVNRSLVISEFLWLESR